MLAWPKIGSECSLMGCFPRPHLGPRLIEETREVSFTHLLACFCSKQIPQRPILVEDLKIALHLFETSNILPTFLMATLIFRASRGLRRTHSQRPPRLKETRMTADATHQHRQQVHEPLRSRSHPLAYQFIFHV